MSDEAHHLRALEEQQILDSVSDPEFYEIVHAARRICGVPLALVSLVATEREWFKAHRGLDSGDTPLDQLCVHALKERELLVINDLAQDSRTRFNPLVTGRPFVRFYAGAVMRDQRGHAIGVVCVVDTAPRPGGLTSSQSDLLTSLARQAIRLLELRRIVNDRDSTLVSSEEARALLQATQTKLINAQQIGRIGSFEARSDREHISTSAEFCRLLGLPDNSEYTRAELIAATLPPAAAWAWDGASMHERPHVEFQFRRTKDGSVRWIARRSAARRLHDVTIVDGTIEDVTEQRLSDARQSALIELGDHLRDATSIVGAICESSRLLGETLGATRAGYAYFDVSDGAWVVDADWSSANVSKVIGRHPWQRYEMALSRLNQGLPLTLSDVTTMPWPREEIEAHLAIQVRAQILVPILQQRQLRALVFVHSDTPRAWTTSELVFTSSVADRLYAAIVKLQAEAQQRVLNDELSHRLKNTLAMVQAIVSRTLRGQATSDVVQTISDRITAFGKGHEALLDERWRAGRASVVARGVLSLLGRDEQIEVHGPDYKLHPQVVMNMSLLLHELGTNAVKYGSLSVPEGRVRLSWQTEPGAGADAFVLKWQESNGPRVSMPERKGFGSKLLSAGLIGTGDVNIAYLESGLVAMFRAPASSVIETHAG